jgi:putative tricarboxylic transport membrane protein
LRYADAVSGIFFALLGIIVVLGTLSFSSLPTADVGPAFFPKIVGGLLVLLGLFLTIKSLLNNVDTRSIKQLFPKGSIKAVITIVIFGVYLFLLKYVGFLISTPLFIISLSLFLKEKRIYLILITSLLVTAFLYFVFQKFLMIPLPGGIFS